MLFDVKYVADWNAIRKCKMAQVLKENKRENSKQREYTYNVGGKVLIKQDHLHILCKTRLLNNGPFTIDQVNNQRGTLTITYINSGTAMEVSIHWVRQFYEC